MNLSESAKSHHVLFAVLVIFGVAILFSMETGKQLDSQSVAMDATTVLILGG